MSQELEKKIVDTRFGKVEGSVENGVARYLGIPYAQPPVGELRFKNPQNANAWDNVFRADRYARDPMQKNSHIGFENYSEDCLYLNIWAPQAADEKCPVMVWIPGGAYATGGSGAILPEGPCLYDGEKLARETGCMIVTISYRLNVFGFLNLSAYSSRFEDNLGMKDVLKALEWIKAAIESFGGDKDNVTLFGQSAGAGVVAALMVLDEAKDYYHKAIIQSNCFGSYYTPEEEMEICGKFLEFAGIEPEHVEKLLYMSYDQIYEAADKLDAYVLSHYFARCTFCPVVDGKLIREFPTLAAFEQLGKPVLVGSNKNEGNFQTVLFGWKDAAAIEKMSRAAVQRLTPGQQEKVLSHYPDLPGTQAFSNLLTDVMYTIPKLRFAENISRNGRVYVYRFDYYTPMMAQMNLYAAHVAEMVPLFDIKMQPYGTFYLGADKQKEEIGKRLRAYWGTFAKTGNPNVKGKIEWLPYDEEERYTLVIGENDSLEKDADKETRDIYEGIRKILI